MIFVYILLALAMIVLAFAIIVALRPAEFRVTRSAAIAALPSIVLAQVNDFHKWEAWSPWAKLDPGMKQTYEGVPAETGAVYYWNGNSKVGEGRMTITESRPSDFLRIKLEFMRPFAGINDVQFTFKPQDAGTFVTWIMDGRNNFITKAFGLFVSMDKMIGGMFEQGLAKLKTISEA